MVCRDLLPTTPLKYLDVCECRRFLLKISGAVRKLWIRNDITHHIFRCNVFILFYCVLRCTERVFLIFSLSFYTSSLYNDI